MLIRARGTWSRGGEQMGARFIGRFQPSSLDVLIFIISALLLGDPAICATKHIVKFRSSNLYPESLDWDPRAQHFVIGSLQLASVHSVSDAGTIEVFVSNVIQRKNVSVLGVTIDVYHNRLLAVLQSGPLFSPFSALAAYDLRTLDRVFLTRLLDNTSDRPVANDVAVDPLGNAFITNSAGNFIWKVDPDGVSSLLSKSVIFSGHQIRDKLAPLCGLNGIAYVKNGYLLAVQSNTGKMYKVDSEDGRAREVLLPKDLVGADGISIRKDGAAVVVSRHTAWLLKSDDGWAESAIFDEIALEEEKFASSVTVREDRSYVLYGHIGEFMSGNADREEFSIEELVWDKEQTGEAVWPFLMVGLGLIYVCYWRFSMRQLIQDINKKTA